MVLHAITKENMAAKAVVLPANTGHLGHEVSLHILWDTQLDCWENQKLARLRHSAGQTVAEPQMASADSSFINRLQALVPFRVDIIL